VLEKHHHAIVLLNISKGITNISRKKKDTWGMKDGDGWMDGRGGSKVTDILLYLDIPKLGSIIWI
jgi:hypothetical protein